MARIVLVGPNGCFEIEQSEVIRDIQEESA